MASLAPVLYVVVVSVVVSGWKNDYDQPRNFNCHSDLYSISRFTSKHDNGPEDRVFDIECTPFLAPCIVAGLVSNNLYLLSSVCACMFSIEWTCELLD